MHCVKSHCQRLAAWGIDRQVAAFQLRLAVLTGFMALDRLVTETLG
jgi:hypothetical protein